MARSLGAQPQPFTATLVVAADADQVARVVRGAGKVEPIDADHCRVHLKADSADWLDSMAAMLAVRFAMQVEEPDDLGTRLAVVSERLALASGAAG